MLTITERTGWESPALWELLLLADPSREMVLCYLRQGRLFTAWEGETLLGVLVLAPIPEGWEIKNLAVTPSAQRRGIGSALITHVKGVLKPGEDLWVGTADASRAALRFYQGNGFLPQRRIEGFFLRNYPEPIWEEDGRCVDMILLRLCRDALDKEGDLS